jgi:prepilin-type N-terminal cleavage/methylation domain-containing protein/prepilin-type processing-associated H-X9-DG protein
MIFPPSRQLGTGRNGFTLVELLVVIAIIGILVALLLPAVQAAREAARRSQCQSNIKNVALAVLVYESARKTTPIGMMFHPLLEASLGTLSRFEANWIINILPYLEEQPLYDSFNFKRLINDAVDSPNYIAHGTSIPILLCPSDSFNRVYYQGPSVHKGNWARGNYAGNAGGAYLLKGCVTTEQCASSADSEGWKSNKRRGVMGPNVSVRIRQITDGTTKTILVGELRAGVTEKDARGIWAMGHAGASLLAMYGSEGDANGPNACYAWSDDVYSDVCQKPLGISECMDCYAGDAFAQATVRSMHKGGAHIAMCDGSVTFISDDVETSGNFGSWGSLWDRLITSADNGMPGDFLGSYP